MDYLKVNFHTDNFTIIDKVIDVLAPLSDVDRTLWVELLGLHSGVFTFLSYIWFCSTCEEWSEGIRGHCSAKP